MTLTAEHLRKVLSYDPETDVFTRLFTGNDIPIGSPAGILTPKGYLRIWINRTLYRAHRLAWLHYYGCWPTNFIDHINGARADNRIANLREATGSQNNINAPRRGRDPDGLKGTRRREKCWEAEIGYNGRGIYLGRFATAQAAHEAYMAASRKLYGEFARAE